MKKIATLLFALALAATACSSDSDGSPGITGGPPATAVSLEDVELLSALGSFGDCDDLLEYLRAETVNRVGPYGLEDGPRFGIPEPFLFDDMAVAESASADSGGAPSSAPAPVVPSSADASVQTGLAGAGGDGDFSTTNVQVEGVDEPDIIKTDGDRILAVAQGHLHYVDISGEEPQYLGSVDLEGESHSGWGQEIFIHSDRALVFTTSYADHLEPVVARDLVGDGVATEDVIFRGRQVSLVQEVDLSDPASMSVVSELRVEGSYLSARAVGDVVWMSVSSYPLQFQFVHPSGPGAEDYAERTNKEIAASASLGTWLPAYRLDGPDGTEAGLLPSCDQLYTPAEFSGFTVLSVLSFNLSEPLSSGDAASVLADGHTLYGSAQSLYLASSTPIYPEAASDGGDGSTSSSSSEPSVSVSIPAPTEWATTVHKFSVSDDGPARYEASGTVDGYLLNQFSMDEHNGYFRMATTTGNRWSGEDSVSQVVVLQQQDQQLTEVGRVGELGRGESIYSVRYAGDLAYVVTFRQIDPLYVLDLSDPANPVAVGELKIPGFSTYLHPLGDGLLVGVGQDADEQGRTQGLKVSLFDVSDPAAPSEVGVAIFPNAGSTAEHDHRAFLYWAPERMVIIPLQEYRHRETDRDPFLGAVALRVSSRAIVEDGRVEHPQPRPSFPGCRPVPDPDVLEDWRGPGGTAAICPARLKVSNPGWGCDYLDADYASKEFPTLGVRGNERLVLCWPYQPPINRLLVADGSLWSMTDNALQSNDLETFAFEDRFSLDTE